MTVRGKSLLVITQQAWLATIIRDIATKLGYNVYVAQDIELAVQDVELARVFHRGFQHFIIDNTSGENSKAPEILQISGPGVMILTSIETLSLQKELIEFLNSEKN